MFSLNGSKPVNFLQNKGSIYINIFKLQIGSKIMLWKFQDFVVAFSILKLPLKHVSLSFEVYIYDLSMCFQ